MSISNSRQRGIEAGGLIGSNRTYMAIVLVGFRASTEADCMARRCRREAFVTELVTQAREGPVVTLTMNRPEKMNLFSPPMRDALIANFNQLGDDPTCRAIVLTGAGQHFSAGGDVRSFTETTFLSARARLERGSGPLARLIAAGRKPVVTAIEGNCYGAGLSMAAASDFAVAASDAKLCAAFVKLGFIPDVGLLWSLPRRVGLGKAKELAALATVIDGEEAARIRLVDAVVEPGEALAKALEMAWRFAEAPPVTMALLKAAFAQDGLESVLKAELDYQPALITTADHAEAKSAFLERRKPVFTGH